MGHEIVIQINGKDGHLTVDAFMDAVRAMAASLADIGKSISGGRGPAWEITTLTRTNPAGVGFAPLTEIGDDVGDSAMAALVEGAAHLESRATMPRHFNEVVLERYGEFVSTLSGGVSSLTIQYNNTIIKPTLHSAANIQSILESAPSFHFENGTIEGRLRVLTEGRGMTASIHDVRSGNHVKCRITEDQADQAKGLWRMRVAISGRIKYNLRGEPVSMDVRKIRPLRERACLPQPEDMGRLDITGGIPSEDHIRNLRDAE